MIYNNNIGCLKLSDLLNDKLDSLKEFEQDLYAIFDENTIELCLLYAQINKLYDLSVHYSEQRIVNGKPIVKVSAVKQKLEYAQAMLSIFKSVLITKIDPKAVSIFIRYVLINVLEKLIQIHGASGYIEQNSSAQVWLDCRNRISKILKKIEIL
jgi:hypothetical protein